MELKTSKGKIFTIDWAATMYTTTRDLAIQFEDPRDISEIANDFENCEWFEWETMAGDVKRAERYSKIKNIGRPQYEVNPLFVQITLLEDN